MKIFRCNIWFSAIYTLFSLVEAKSENCESTGFPCCSEGVSVIYKDDTGEWGVENNDWCFIGKNNDKKTCFSEKLGYPCCFSSYPVVTRDNDGPWGIENKNWCGIIEKNPEECTEEDVDCFGYGEVINSYMVEVAMSEDVSSLNIFEPEAKEYIKPLEEKVLSFLKEFKENNYDDPSEPRYSQFGRVKIISSISGDSLLYSVIMPPYVAKKVQELPNVNFVIKDVAVSVWV